MKNIIVPESCFITPERLQDIVDEVEKVYKLAGNVSYAGYNALKILIENQRAVLDAQPRSL